MGKTAKEYCLLMVLSVPEKIVQTFQKWYSIFNTTSRLTDSKWIEILGKLWFIFSRKVYFTLTRIDMLFDTRNQWNCFLLVCLHRINNIINFIIIILNLFMKKHCKWNSAEFSRIKYSSIHFINKYHEILIRLIKIWLLYQYYNIILG